MTSLIDIIMPVLQSIPESHLKSELIQGFMAYRRHLGTIETGFRALTARKQDPERLRHFFQSWSQTNNSAMTTAGIGNRLTLQLHRGQNVADQVALLRALTSLDRIIDEDLAVTNRMLHSQMFYKMATDIVGDDDWLLLRYLHPDAKSFKEWKDDKSLRGTDLMIPLLTTLTHEIYTHGEVEFILPFFTRWLREDYDFSEAECRKALAWISVHCGPTERNHFFHALDAIGHYSTAMDVKVDDYALDGIIGSYLQKKASVIEHVCPSVVREIEAVH
jgi:hypothetical protein